MGFFRSLFGAPASPVPDPAYDDPASVFAVIDVETTGLNPDFSRIVEIGVSRRNARFEEVDRWETLVRPDPCPRSIKGKKIHGIGLDMLREAPTFAGIQDELSKVLDGHILLAHNARFDVGFINAEAKRNFTSHGFKFPADFLYIGNVIDTLDLAKQQLDHGPYKLDTLLERFGLDNSRAHSAGADAAVTGNLLSVMYGDGRRRASKALRDTDAQHRDTEVPKLGHSNRVLPRS